MNISIHESLNNRQSVDKFDVGLSRKTFLIRKSWMCTRENSLIYLVLLRMNIDKCINCSTTKFIGNFLLKINSSLLLLNFRDFLLEHQCLPSCHSRPPHPQSDRQAEPPPRPSSCQCRPHRPRCLLQSRSRLKEGVLDIPLGICYYQQIRKFPLL